MSLSDIRRLHNRPTWLYLSLVAHLSFTYLYGALMNDCRMTFVSNVDCCRDNVTFLIPLQSEYLFSLLEVPRWLTRRSHRYTTYEGIVERKLENYFDSPSHCYCEPKIGRSLRQTALIWWQATDSVIIYTIARLTRSLSIASLPINT